MNKIYYKSRWEDSSHRTSNQVGRHRRPETFHTRISKYKNGYGYISERANNSEFSAVTNQDFYLLRYDSLMGENSWNGDQN